MWCVKIACSRSKCCEVSWESAQKRSGPRDRPALLVHQQRQRPAQQRVRETCVTTAPQGMRAKPEEHRWYRVRKDASVRAPQDIVGPIYKALKRRSAEARCPIRDEAHDAVPLQTGQDLADAEDRDDRPRVFEVHSPRQCYVPGDSAPDTMVVAPEPRVDFTQQRCLLRFKGIAEICRELTERALVAEGEFAELCRRDER
jgi:hypothetical protein